MTSLPWERRGREEAEQGRRSRALQPPSTVLGHKHGVVAVVYVSANMSSGLDY